MPGVGLGLGLVSLGRAWGARPVPLPSDEESAAFLAKAAAAGIRFYDTAPSYGPRTSERRLGTFLRSLDSPRLAEFTVATKCGEHWRAGESAPYSDHSYDALCRSIDQSLECLPKVDLLQIHKSTPAVMRDSGVRRALDYAAARGVRQFGVSVTDLETAMLAVDDPFYSTLQIVFNLRNRKLEPVFERAARAGKRILVNRPFGMGELLYGGDGSFLGAPAMVEAFRFILKRPFEGWILTGTRSYAHLGANLAAFRDARF
ncbi:MAG: aldo/keto reductase [Acidobacteria bacterium]|nr:aldo/keto reductase [Acidobacteriota bacterium]